MRPDLPPSTSAKALTVTVLARPGTPSSRTCPPESRAISKRSSRRSGSPDTGPANSGLTGDPVIEEPPDQGPKDWRTRWRTLKESVRGTTAALPQVLRLVWDASPGVTAGLFAATVVAGVIPAISA